MGLLGYPSKFPVWWQAAPGTDWLIEGLPQYVDALSAPGSVPLYDVVGTALLEAPFLRPTLELMQKRGTPWAFGDGYGRARQ